MPSKPRVPSSIVLHHAGYDYPQSDHLVQVMQKIDDWHRDRGFAMIGYHYVCRQKQWGIGRPMWRTGAHARGYNHLTGVCLAADFTNVDQANGHTPASKLAYHLPGLTNLLQDKFSGEVKIYLHRSLARTECPGFDLETLRSAINLAKDDRGGRLGFDAIICHGDIGPYLLVKVPERHIW